MGLPFVTRRNDAILDAVRAEFDAAMKGVICYWHSIDECVPPEGCAVLLWERLVVDPNTRVVVGMREGDVYKRILMRERDWFVDPTYWMHIPPNDREGE